MSNETKNHFRISEEEEKLVDIYKNIIDGTATASADQQSRFLLQLLNTKITQLEPKTARVKKLNYFLKICAMFLSGLSTVILGLRMQQNWLSSNTQNIALIISASVTFLTSLSVFWDTETFWIRNKVMLNKLKELRYEYVFYLHGTENKESEKLKLFLERFISCLGDEYWEKFLANIQPGKKEVS
ncbi:MAG: DUF4231 domain-containing protein [Chitinophagales bacterium]